MSFYLFNKPFVESFFHFSTFSVFERFSLIWTSVTVDNEILMFFKFAYDELDTIILLRKLCENCIFACFFYDFNLIPNLLGISYNYNNGNVYDNKRYNTSGMNESTGVQY